MKTPHFPSNLALYAIVGCEKLEARTTIINDKIDIPNPLKLNGLTGREVARDKTSSLCQALGQNVDEWKTEWAAEKGSEWKTAGREEKTCKQLLKYLKLLSQVVLHIFFWSIVSTIFGLGQATRY